MKNIFLISALMLLFHACTDAKKAKFSGFGSKFQIEMLNCDGSVARTWISSGKVSSEQHSDGYYFMEEGTDRLIEVTGRLIITKID